LLYVNSNEMAWVLRLVPVPKTKALTSGRDLYLRNCAGCHREDFTGTPPQFPSLVGIEKRLGEGRVLEIIRDGTGRMPGFAHLQTSGVAAITRFVVARDVEDITSSAGPSPMDLDYTIDGYNKFLDPDGYPAVEPPWGTLNAINLDQGKIQWSIPFGEFPELAAKGIRNTGTENYGGAVVTAGGLLFIGATNHDRKFRAFDKRNGKLLWETTLPFAGNATPATYEIGGRQYVVIAAGGGKSKSPPGGMYVAFGVGPQ
jgi:quinoprotein glucose dehydrogenase